MFLMDSVVGVQWLVKISCENKFKENDFKKKINNSLRVFEVGKEFFFVCSFFFSF